VVGAVTVLVVLTFLAVVKVLQPSLLARRAARLDADDLERTARFLRRHDTALPVAAVVVCLVAAASDLLLLGGAWPFWLAGAGAAVALGVAGRGAVPRVDAVLRAHGVEPGERARFGWLDATVVLFALTWVVRTLAVHPELERLALGQVVLLPALTACAAVAAWSALRDDEREGPRGTRSREA
jgi:hypothetical protein